MRSRSAEIDFVIQFIDKLVVRDHPGCKVRVAADDRFDRPRNLRFGQPAHLDDVVVQVFELFVVGFDDMVACLGFNWHGYSL